MLVSISLIHCWKSSHGRKWWTWVGWDGVLISSFASAAFRSQQICNSLEEISCLSVKGIWQPWPRYLTWQSATLWCWGNYPTPLFKCNWLFAMSNDCIWSQWSYFRNCFQTACAVSWSFLGLCAISAKTGHNHLRIAHHLALSTLCRLTPHVAGE